MIFKSIKMLIGLALISNLSATSLFAGQIVVNETDFEEFGVIETCNNGQCWKTAKNDNGSFIVFYLASEKTDYVNSETIPLIGLTDNAYHAIEAKYIVEEQIIDGGFTIFSAAAPIEGDGSGNASNNGSGNGNNNGNGNTVNIGTGNSGDNTCIAFVCVIVVQPIKNDPKRDVGPGGD